jgi:hypothetical protein
MQIRGFRSGGFRRVAALTAALLAMSLAGLFGDGPRGAAHAQAEPWSCLVNGGGELPAGDSFGGIARGDARGGVAEGRWIHVSPEGDVLRGTVHSLACRSDGGAMAGPPQEEVNRAFVSGTGSWNGDEGFEFQVSLADRGEPGDDEYIIVILDPDGEVQHLAVDILAGGNIQIHAR